MEHPFRAIKRQFGQLNIHSTAIASLRSLYSNADRTISNYRAWVREQLLFSIYDSDAEARLQGALSQQAIDASSVDELIASAQEWLFDNRIVLLNLPPYSRPRPIRNEPPGRP